MPCPPRSSKVSSNDSIWLARMGLAAVPANLKSRILAWPRRVTKCHSRTDVAMDNTSECAASGPSAICGEGKKVRVERLTGNSVLHRHPSINSMAMNGRLLSCPTSQMVQIFGWLSADAAWASR